MQVVKSKSALIILVLGIRMHKRYHVEGLTEQLAYSLYLLFITHKNHLSKYVVTQ